MSISAPMTTTQSAVSITMQSSVTVSKLPIASAASWPTPCRLKIGLGEDRAAADHLRDVKTPQRDDRQQAHAQDVLDEHLPLRQALGAGGAHVVLAHRVEDRAAQHARVEADEQHRQREPRRQHVPQPLGGVLLDRDIVAQRDQAGLVADVDRSAPSRAGTAAARRRPSRARSARGRCTCPSGSPRGCRARSRLSSQRIPAPIASDSVAGRSEAIC